MPPDGRAVLDFPGLRLQAPLPNVAQDRVGADPRRPRHLVQPGPGVFNEVLPDALVGLLFRLQASRAVGHSVGKEQFSASTAIPRFRRLHPHVRSDAPRPDEAHLTYSKMLTASVSTSTPAAPACNSAEAQAAAVDPVV